jgi:uncharacterized iron-regulated membrane protein
VRWLILTHRYLGIVLGILMAAWCLSGIVMMYVGYPELDRADRVHALRALDLSGCCTSLEGAESGSSFQIEMLGNRPVMRLGAQVIDLTSGQGLDSISAAQATAVATDFVSGARLLGSLAYDQWTLEGVRPQERPLYHFASPGGTELYVSRTSGRLVKFTTPRERFWNWLGAVPHWLYFADLRRNAALWTRVVVWTSLFGCFLTLTGLYLGVQRFVRRPAGRLSPYRGLLLWHHVPGFFAGVFALSWVASGLVSMNPWGFLEDDWRPPDVPNLTGAQVNAALRAPLPAGTVSVESSRLNGQLYLIATTANGVRTRLDARGAPAPLSAAEIEQWAATVTGSTAIPELLRAEDTYYFSHHREVAQLPVYRASVDDARYYFDATSGKLLRRIDINSRWYRWLHQGLHRMDFTPTLRARPLWDVVMWILMSAVTTISITGTILGIRRLRPRAG